MARKQLCTVVTRGEECQREIPDDIKTSLCARHLLLASAEVEEVGRDYLISIVRQEGL
ncbi:hypothetical protein [Herbiconiux solani]|uniref:hypothetical protein n=1 Tax=Herbiconiux solani TaxID=661329 RepID=UPI0012EE2607|nr:hypothetical protein [Herbiconiux solani]